MAILICLEIILGNVGAEDKKAREDAKAHAAREKAIEELKVKYPESKIEELSEMIGRIDDILEAVFNFLVPPTGKCDSVAGELIRAIMRVSYRDWNDGDVFYEGYGRETCLPSVAYIIEQFPDMYDDFDEIADEILSRLFDSSPELFFWAPNSTNSLDTDISPYADWEPTDYDYEGDFPDSVVDALYYGKISESDVESSIENTLSWEGIRYDYLSINEYGWHVEGLTLEDYERLEDIVGNIGSSIVDDLDIESLSDDDEEDW